MTETTNGATILAGDQTSAIGGAQPAPAPETSGQASQDAANSAASKGADSAAGNWYDSIQDSDLKGYAQQKGWKDPTEVLNGYRNLEKLIGSEKIPMPKDASDKEGWSRVYDALGRPKTADEYKLPVPEGTQGDFAKAASSKFHELGISQQQASALAEWWNQTQSGEMEKMTQTQAQQSEQGLNQLRQQWGQAWDENVELGRRAAREFGVDRDKLGKIEQALGTKEMLEFMARVGRGLTEHEFEGGKSTNSFGMTPDAARSRINDLRADKEWSSRYLQGNADAKAEMARLMALAYPER